MTKYWLYEKEKTLPSTPAFQAYLSPESTVIVSIDMHEGHLSEHEDCPCPAPRGRDIIDRADMFHRQAREIGIPVIHVVSKLRRSGVDDIKGIPAAWRLTMSEHFGKVPGINEHAIEGTRWNNLCTEFDPRDELVDGKRRLSAFFPTDLDFMLRQMNVRTVVFTGVNVDCCVLNSAFDASNRNYQVIVVRDATAGTDEYLEAAGRSIISLFLGLVMDSDELIQAWSQDKNTVA